MKSLLLTVIILHLLFSRATGGKIQNMKKHPGYILTQSGDNVNINCPNDFPRSPFTLLWTLDCDDSTLLQDHPLYKGRVIFSSGKHQMTIQNVTEQDSRMYCCHLKAADGKIQAGRRIRLQVTNKLEDSLGHQETGHEKYILYTVIGAEAFVIIILIAVVIKWRPRGLSRTEDQGLQSHPSELQYADICKNSSHQQSGPRINVQEVTYSAVKFNKQETGI
ncbi:uncharacterized protein LOC122946623 [Bufo gargarizans]|uniref:uncharacterized protein LOC122946623 n=1 Tax=Bufo gargarizans TaxID=30331 RepID=UPI001CF25781|nr:uncharacterized protein LOC122946623 [Bufo gargarizans]